MITFLSIAFLAWAIFNNGQMGFFGSVRIPFVSAEFQTTTYLGMPAWILYLTISDISGIVGAFYIYFTYF